MSLTEEEARARIDEERSFFIHLATFIATNTMLFWLNILTGTGHFWFLYPLLGWGIGLVSHAVTVFGLPGVGRSWEERRLHELSGGLDEAAQQEQLRRLLKEESETLALPAASLQEDLGRMQRRIEHLEAIVTSEDWDRVHDPDRLRLDDATDQAEETPENRAERLSRRVR